MPPSPTTAASAEAFSAAQAGTPPARKARFWDRVARKYAADPIADLAGYEATLERVRDLLRAEHEALEVGCGTGSTALRLAPHTGRMLATDVSGEMIAIAHEKLRAQPVPQLSFAVADADGPAIGPPRSYDVALAFNMLHLVNDLDRALAQLVQSLQPGGLLISKTPCLAEMHPLVTRVAIPLMRAIGKAPHVLTFSAAELRLAMRRQGLEIVSVERHGTQRKDIRVFIVARKPG